VAIAGLRGGGVLQQAPRQSSGNIQPHGKNASHQRHDQGQGSDRNLILMERPIQSTQVLCLINKALGVRAGRRVSLQMKPWKSVLQCEDGDLAPHKCKEELSGLVIRL